MTVAVVASPLPAADAGAVERLAAVAARHDGAQPLNEQTLLHLRGPHDGEWHALADDETGTFVGYAHRSGDGSAEVVVSPVARRRGVGTALVRSLPDDGGLRLWAHERTATADAFAASLGLTPIRELYRMRREADSAPGLPTPRWPDDVAVRTFQTGVDERAWLELNARAFADHPEQAGWGPDDLADRLSQPWFDPDGFFLAVDRRDGRLAGFHWTKVHPVHAARPAHGEVYVVGVDPSYQGTGLGKALTVAGVRHLHDIGLSVVELYVDAANTTARELYRGLGFADVAVDVQYAPAR